VSWRSAYSFRFFSGMIGASSCTISGAVTSPAAGSSGCMCPSLRIIGTEPTHRCRSDAPCVTIEWNI
jgi:hypothetical protein